MSSHQTCTLVNKPLLSKFLAHASPWNKARLACFDRLPTHRSNDQRTMIPIPMNPTDTLGEAMTDE